MRLQARPLFRVRRRINRLRSLVSSLHMSRFSRTEGSSSSTALLCLTLSLPPHIFQMAVIAAMKTDARANADHRTKQDF
jgi:hypothetical protein